MNRPKLQLALDNAQLSSALEAAHLLAEYVDIIEAGTILCISEGMQAVKTLRQRYPHHTLVADLKIADAGEALANMAFNAGANRMTVICAAPLATMEKALEIAKRYHGDIQIELFGHWTLEDARNWRAIGLQQVIYHRGREAQANGQVWERKDLDRMKALSDLGFRLSITGGIEPNDLVVFKNIAADAFIIGRGLVNAAYPKLAAKAFHQAINSIWVSCTQ